MFSNRLDDLVNSSDKEDIISCHQNRNAISFQLLVIEKNRVVGHSELEERIEGVKKDMSDISFLY